MSARLIPLDDRPAWEAALEGVPHAFWHTWDSCRAVTATGLRTVLYVLEEDGVRVVCPLVERPAGEHVDVVTPYGFSGFVGTAECPALPASWHEFARDAGYVCGYIMLNPALTDPSYFLDTAVHHRSVFVFDLRIDEEALFARLSTNRRREVRKADKEGWLSTEQEALADFFVETYPDFMGRRGAAQVYDLSDESLRQLCESPMTLLMGAERDGVVRSASLFAYTQSAGEYLFNVSLPGEEAYSAPLIWAAVRALKGEGVPSLNLGGGIREGDGVEQFKERFGADRVSLRVVKQVFRPDIYRELCEQAGVDPETADYFPAYRAASRAM